MFNYGIRVLCVRAFQNKIEESVYPLIKAKTQLLGVYEYFTFTKSSIICKKTGSKSVFYGLNRNTDEIKSLENISICWIEEGSFITKNQFNILTPTIRAKNSEIWISFNPLNSNDFIFSSFIKNKKTDAIVRKINYTDNPYCPTVIIKEAEAMKKEDEKLYNHVYMGECLDDDTSRFFKNVSSSLCNIKEYGRILIGFDVADSGEDSSVITVETNGILIYIDEILGSYEKAVKSLKSVIRNYITMKKEIFICYDAIGVGAGVGHALEEFRNIIKIVPFKASSKPIRPNKKEILPYKNKDIYYNLKAQIWHVMGYNTKEIKHQNVKKIDELIEQLETPKITYSQTKIIVEKKSDLKKRGVKSPNIADSYICILFVKYSLNMYWH